MAGSAAIPRELLTDVELLSLDAGNVVVFLDHARLARLCADLGLVTSPEALVRAEGRAKRAMETGHLVDVPWSSREAPGALGWGRLLATILEDAGCPRDRLTSALEALWSEHLRMNLWSMVPPGLRAALLDVRATGVRVAVVSNAEATLEAHFAALGIGDAFDTIVDSGVVGVEKPDPAIFRIAMERCRATPATTVHLGDTFATDTLGARASGIRTALVDVHGQLEGRHLDVARVPGAAEVARAIVEAGRAAAR